MKDLQSFNDLYGPLVNSLHKVHASLLPGSPTPGPGPQMSPGLCRGEGSPPSASLHSSWATDLYICEEDKGMGTHMGSPRKERAAPAHIWLLSLPLPQELRGNTPTILKCTSHDCRKALQGWGGRGGSFSLTPHCRAGKLHVWDENSMCTLRLKTTLPS